MPNTYGPLAATQVTNDWSYSVQCHLNESYWIAKILATQIQHFLWCVQYMFNFLHRSSSHVMGWSVPVLEKGSEQWHRSWKIVEHAVLCTLKQYYNYNVAVPPANPCALLDWLSDVGECITLDIHILLCCSECSETWLLMHCKVLLIADICKLRLQPLQTSDNHSPHASHFRSWSLFFSAQCCYCPKTLSAAAYREVWIHSNQQHNGPMCWHLASCESRAWQKGQNTHCGKQTSHIYNCNTKHIQWERCSKTPVFDCSARTRASGVLFWQSITSHRWGLNKHRVVLFGLDSRPAATWLLRKTRHTWMIWSINLNGLTNDNPLVEVKNTRMYYHSLNIFPLLVCAAIQVWLWCHLLEDFCGWHVANVGSFSGYFPYQNLSHSSSCCGGAWVLLSCGHA